MIINVTGGNAKERLAVNAAALFYADILLHPATNRKIVVDIEISSTGKFMGLCVNEDAKRNPREFTIHFRKKKGDDCMLKTLAHEMVHLKQFAKNELTDVGGNKSTVYRGGQSYSTKWMGKVWAPKGKEHPYYDAPWEIAAYGQEVGLYKRLVERIEELDNEE